MPLERKHIPPQGQVFSLGGGAPVPESETPPSLSGWTLLPNLPGTADMAPTLDTDSPQDSETARNDDSSTA